METVVVVSLAMPVLTAACPGPAAARSTPETGTETPNGDDDFGPGFELGLYALLGGASAVLAGLCYVVTELVTQTS